jgi:hypothetical protein
MKQVTKNCHYVSRFLTRPWEGHQRFLRYYDFDKDRFGWRSSESLLAAEKINSARVELWLKQMVEDPFAAARDRIARGDQSPVGKRTFDAAMLMVLLQGGRVATIADVDAARQLDKLGSMSESDLNAMLNQVRRLYDVRVIHTVSNADKSGFRPLYIPSTGVFTAVVVPALGLHGGPFAFGIPIHPVCALLLTPVEWPDDIDLSQTRMMLAAWSIGASKARRVVILPGMYEQEGEAAMRELLLEARRNNEKLIAAVS